MGFRNLIAANIMLYIYFIQIQRIKSSLTIKEIPSIND